MDHPDRSAFPGYYTPEILNRDILGSFNTYQRGKVKPAHSERVGLKYTVMDATRQSLIVRIDLVELCEKTWLVD